MKGWPRKTLGEICGFVRGPFGGSLKKSVFVADGYAVYEQQHAIYDQFDEIRYFIDDAKFREMQRFELRPNDLIMSCSGTMGKVAIVPDGIRRGIINQALLKLTPTKTVSPEFLKYWMDSDDFQDSLREQSGGAAIQNVASVSILKEIQISLPPLAEQQRIVGLLDEAFEGLATAKANAEKNLQNARALFESHLQSVFTQRGPGWVETTLEGVVDADCTLSYGIVQPGDDYPGGMPIVRPTDLTAKAITLEGLKRIDPKLADGYRRTTLRGKELLLCVRGSTGVVSITTPELAGANVTRGLVPIVFEPSRIRQDFGYYMMTSEAVQSQIRAKTYGTALMQINIGDLRKLTVSFPSLKQQEKMSSELDALSAETQSLTSLYERKLAALEALKKSLLHQAFTGEL